MVLKEAPLPEDIRKLGVEDGNRPWKTYKSVRLITKNEPVASRNIFHRA
ncbi:hypothetical protein IMSAGC002_02623 [Lachnospiraceae bacterium]|nr:hypothetical protein IMSAGC002_02623 [Lachnospiraceae bacterium]